MRAGLEPRVSRLQVQCSNRSATLFSVISENQWVLMTCFWILMFPYISSVVHWGGVLIRRLALFADTIMTNPLWNRPFHGLWRHLGWGANTAKITVNAWNFGPLGTAITPLQRGGFPQQKCTLKDICTEFIFMKYKEEIQVMTTANEFLRFHTNLSNQHYANYHEIRSHVRRFMIRIYRRRSFFNSSIFCWMNDINETF